MIHIYCGNGKGKTTGAIGLGVRGAGSGMQVKMVQFLKGSDSSEVAVLNAIPNFQLVHLFKPCGFLFQMQEQEKKALKEEQDALLQKCLEEVKLGKWDMLILDEICASLEYGVCTEALVRELIEACGECCELVLTGRTPKEWLLEQADYVSEIQAVKHPYEKGMVARKGIEF